MKKSGGEYYDRIAGEVFTLIEPVVSDLGYELVEVVLRREQHGLILRVVIYQPSGIGVDDCAKVSREVSHLLDVEDLVEPAYFLEVSSPGLDRPLVTDRDFLRYLGKPVGLGINDPAEEIIGNIIGVDEAGIHLEVEGNRVDIPRDRIRKARLVIEF
ncbi:MAG: ribosome maturation factor RimP [Proteobacteria bacterium]|nr:ribosome maturation factor RimP [Pseudomonadota bacterium]MBU1685983.1 ribosome maturation factor RimP [Pseudomonadota bacterium]